MGQTVSSNDQVLEANAENKYQITNGDLPLHCPLDSMSLWNSHPKVYLPLNSEGKAQCPYCGAEYTLVD